MMDRILTKRIIAAGLALASSAWADSTSPRYILDPFAEVLRHQQRQWQEPEAVGSQSDNPVGALLPDAGQIALMDDSDGISIPAVPFNLDQKTLQFQPGGTNASQYAYSLIASRFDPGIISSSTVVRLGDDDAAQVNIPFSFPFHGQRYTALFIHSDGNLTFAFPETSSIERNAGRLVSGPPRLAPLFADLDPTQPDASVTFGASASRVVVTWKNVPLFSDSPGGAVGRQTFQAALFPDGRIEFSYAGVAVSSVGSVPVGIAPGGATSASSIAFVDFSAAPIPATPVAIVQVFSSSPQFDFWAIIPKFYRNHEDAYDFLVVFDTVTRSPGVCGLSLAVRNRVHGIGLRRRSSAEEFDAGGSLGSAARLQSFVYLGDFSRHPADPEQRGVCGANFSPLTLLGQLTGSRFLAYPTFVDPATGQRSSELLGRGSTNWSFYLNTDASVQEGNQIEDKGQGVSPRFETREILQRYSPLDQYLMGLRAPEDVPRTFLVRPPADFLRSRPPSSTPQSGVRFDGTRLDITVPMIVAAEGRRAPDYTLAPKRFRFAFALLVKAGTAPQQGDVDKLDRFRTAWEAFFARATDNRGQAETQLAKQLQLSTWPATGLIQGRTITASVTLGAAATSAVTVNLSASGSAVQVPQAVTISPGSRVAEFAITATGSGIAELTARGPSDSYELARSFLQVLPSTAGLTLERLETELLSAGLIVPSTSEFLRFSGGRGVSVGEDLVFRLRDENFLPYPGLRLNATPSGGSSLTPSDLSTDAQGQVRTKWKLDAGFGVSTLLLSLDGQPDVSVVTKAVATALPPRHR